MFKCLLPIAALLGMLLLPFGAAAEEEIICEHVLSYECAVNQYSSIKNAACEKSGRHTCMAHTEPPGVTQFNCRLRNGVYNCSVFPRGKYTSYSYYGAPGLSLSTQGPTYTPTLSVSCNSPMVPRPVTVTVTSPFGISSSESFTIPCGQPWN